MKIYPIYLIIHRSMGFIYCFVLTTKLNNFIYLWSSFPFRVITNPTLQPLLPRPGIWMKVSRKNNCPCLFSTTFSLPLINLDSICLSQVMVCWHKLLVNLTPSLHNGTSRTVLTSPMNYNYNSNTLCKLIFQKMQTLIFSAFIQRLHTAAHQQWEKLKQLSCV